MTADVLQSIREALPRLRAAEQRVAAAILERPTIVPDSTITQLAAHCGTSQATVARFCAALGFSGYRELRVRVAAADSRERARLDRFSMSDGEIDPNDTAAEVAAKILYQETQAIEQTANSLDLDALDSVVAALRGATRIDLYGFGSSGLTAQDLHQKLLRIGFNAHHWSDAHLALTSAALLTPDAVAVGISHSGVTIETNQALEVARAAGATTVAITNFPDSPIAERADLVLATRAREARYRSGAMSSRIAQLALIDILFVRVAQGMLDRLTESLRLTYEAVQSHRLPNGRGRAPRG